MLLPCVIAILIVNLVFAVITRSAPQFNIFKLWGTSYFEFGLIILSLGFNGLTAHAIYLFEQGFQLLQEFFKLSLRRRAQPLMANLKWKKVTKKRSLHESIFFHLTLAHY